MFRRRAAVVGILVVLVFVGLTARLAWLQFSDAAAKLADDPDVVRDVASPAARGAIYDRDGVLLRASRASFDVSLFAAVFRESSVVEAAADLGALLDPAAHQDRDALADALAADPEKAAFLFALSTDVLRLPAAERGAELMARGASFLAPHGTFLRPVGALRRRPFAAAIAVAPRGSSLTESVVRRRAAAGAPTLGALLDAAPEDFVTRVKEEEAALLALGRELGFKDASAVRAAAREACFRHRRRVEEIVERRLRDAVLMREFDVRPEGAPRTREEERALASKVAAPFSDEARARRALETAFAAAAGAAPLKGATPAPPSDVDPIARAKELGLYETDPERVRDAAARSVLEAEDFDVDAYHDERKRAQMRDDLAAFRSDVFGRGGGFALADLVDGPGGLRALGFRLEPNFGRDPSRARAGVSTALLLGSVTAEGVPTGGVEERLDSVLRGTAGLAKSSGGEIVVVRPPVHGQDATLTLSAALQDRLDKLTTPAPSEEGAIVVVDVATGGVLGASSWPRPSAANVERALEGLLDAHRELEAARAARRRGESGAARRLALAREAARSSPAVHRGVASPGQTPPGSVFKALTMLVGLEAGAVTESETLSCLPVDRAFFRCHGHGAIDLGGALERSCNAYCYELGTRIGAPRLVDFYELLGLFDAAPGLSTAAEARGLLEILRRGEDDVRNLAIGQGSLSFAPYRAAAVAASLASGRVVRPHLHRPEGFEPIGPSIGSEAHLRAVRDGMRRVVMGPFGTARASRRALEKFSVAGKTGTAQLTTARPWKFASWFVGFAPYGDGRTPKYAFAVMFDRSDEEGKDAAPLAAKTMEACFAVMGGS